MTKLDELPSNAALKCLEDYENSLKIYGRSKYHLENALKAAYAIDGIGLRAFVKEVCETKNKYKGLTGWEITGKAFDEVVRKLGVGLE